MNSIIIKQTIPLDDQFASIKKIIEEKEDFTNLAKICSFNDKQKSLTFKMEKIHPKCIKKNISPVMLLFSNPHPLSVQTGIFLSEPRSRSFWQRLMDCSYINPPEKLIKAVTNWTSKTPSILSNYLIEGEYSEKFILFFDCLEALPTNQYGDLKKLFTGKEGRELRKRELQNPGYKNIIKISKHNNIKSWVVFSAEAYRYIVAERNIAKDAPNRICKAIDDYVINKNTNKFWKSLKDLKITIQHDSYEVTVYLSLIARRKDWKTQNGEKYFTIMLNQIFDHISGNN